MCFSEDGYGENVWCLYLIFMASIVFQELKRVIYIHIIHNYYYLDYVMQLLCLIFH